MVLSAIMSVASLLLVIGLGFFLSRRGHMTAATAKFVSWITFTFSIPCLIIVNMEQYFTASMLREAGFALLLPMGVMLGSYTVARLLCMLLRVAPTRRGVTCAMFTFSNTILTGLPINSALFGEQSMPYALFYFMCNSFLFWTLGVWGVRRDAQKKDPDAPREPVFSVKTLKKLLPPSLVVFLLSLGLILLEVKIPDVLMDAFRYVGNLSTPLSLLYTGYVLGTIQRKSIHLGRDTALSVCGKYGFTPLVTFLLLCLIPMPSLMKNVYFVQSAMPVMAQTTIVAAAYGADQEYAASVFAITTVASIAVLPLIATVIGIVGF